MLVNLDLSAAQHMKAIRELHGDKGLKKRDWEAILSALVCRITDKDFERVIEDIMPDELVLKNALRDADFKKLLIEFARKKSKIKKLGGESVLT